MNACDTTVVCATDDRRRLVRAADLGGLDAVEAEDDGLTLELTFLGKAPAELEPQNIRIDGGRRITSIHAVEVTIEREEDPELDDRALVVVDRTGDTSVYRLRLVEPDEYGRPGELPLDGFDPAYSCAEFVFHPQCPTDADCRPACVPEPVEPDATVIDYTARDYATLRRLLLDRATLTMPDWLERHVPDLGVTVLELLAYLGDRYEYRLDSVSTEAYLRTARLRPSIRRHALLIDYRMHDGCNARAYLHVAVDADAEVIEPPTERVRFAAVDVSRVDPRERPSLASVLTDADLSTLPPAARYEIFEPLQAPDRLRAAHNAIRFHTFGDRQCVLPAGATAAALADPDRRIDLRPGDLLLIEQVRGPVTGAEADADPDKRWVVRLTTVETDTDEVTETPLLIVGWDPEDAPDADVVLSAIGGPECELIEDVSLARGNVFLVDHGTDPTFCAVEPGEQVAVPPGPVPPLDCCPGPCPDRPDRGPAGDLVAAQLAAARRGEQLTTRDTELLAALVGVDALDRAGVDADDPAAAQAAALETLLAQVSYPAVDRPFRPRLARSSVTRSAPYPEPERVASGQAELLATIEGRARHRLTELREVLGGDDPLTGDQIAELTAIAGRDVLDELGFDPADAGSGGRSERALTQLLLRFDQLLAGKLARIRRLTERAAGGEVLGPWLGWELTQTWGARLADGLAPDDPRLAGPARWATGQDPRAALPQVVVHATELGGTGEQEPAGTWYPAHDLIDTAAQDRCFVGETDNDARTTLRFGLGTADRPGLPLPPGGTARLVYRVGNGIAGNVGAEAIGHLLLCAPGTLDGVAAVRNPLPAVGGVEPEPVARVREVAPLAPRRVRLRAITPDDYAEQAAAVRGVQAAAAELRWNGTGQEVHVAIDPLAGFDPDAVFAAVYRRLAGVRRIGHRVEVRAALAVPIDLAIEVCARPGQQRGSLHTALRRVLGAGRTTDGGYGLFHPDARSFGDPVRVSRIVAVAAALPGVASVTVTRLRRLGESDRGELAAGLLPIRRLEVAELADDVNRPENGRLRIEIGGARP